MFSYCIAEDEYYVQRSIEERVRTFDPQFCLCGCAYTGSEAEKLYDEQNPDLFFVDIYMPQCSGLEFIETIRRKDHACQTLFIIVSGYSDYSQMHRAIKVGVFDYLQKPILPAEFNQMMKRVVQQLNKEKGQEMSLLESMTFSGPDRDTLFAEIPVDTQKEELEKKTEDGDRIEQICSYIQKHYQEDITNKALADTFYLSSSYLSHVFKEKTGSTPGKYLEDVRLLQAKKLLENTSLSIARISELTGYKDANYFAKCYRKKYGVSPREDRN